MPSITEIQTRLALYKQAEAAILEGSQSYRVGMRQFTRADLAQVRAAIDSMESQLAVAKSGGRLGHSVAVFGGRR